MLSRRVLLTSLAPFGRLRGIRAQMPDELRFRAGADLVIAPATVVDARRRYVQDLEPSDFRLYDDDVEQRIFVDDERMPISLAVAVHATIDARKALHAFRRAANLFGPLVAGENGEAALIAIRGDAEVVVEFTSDFGKFTDGVRSLQARGSGCSFVDAVAASTRLLSDRPANRRRVIVVMAEARDYSSKGDLRDTLIALQREHVTVYALTYSPSLMAFGREVPPGP